MIRNAKIRGGSIEIMIDWVRNNDVHPHIASEVHAFISTLNWEHLFENRRNPTLAYYST